MQAGLENQEYKQASKQASNIPETNSVPTDSLESSASKKNTKIDIIARVAVNMYLNISIPQSKTCIKWCQLKTGQIFCIKLKLQNSRLFLFAVVLNTICVLSNQVNSDRFSFLETQRSNAHILFRLGAILIVTYLIFIKDKVIHGYRTSVTQRHVVLSCLL